MSRQILFVLLLFSLSSALVIAPRIFEQDDFDDPMFPELAYSLSADCTAATVSVYVLDEDLKPVRDANTYLKYVDFASPLISSAKTDKDGFVIHKLPGDGKLMRGMFILVMQKSGYRSKEVHFDLAPCYSDWVPPQPPPPPQQPPPQQPPQVNQTEPEENVTVPPVQPPPNLTNETEEHEPGEAEPPAVCPYAFAIPLMLFYKISKRW